MLIRRFYGALLNEQAGVLDDLIVYRLAEGFRCVVNASTRAKVLAWMQQHALPDASFEHKPQVMIAVQGPNAIKRVLEVEAVSAFDRACAVLCYATWRMVDRAYRLYRRRRR